MKNLEQRMVQAVALLLLTASSSSHAFVVGPTITSTTTRTPAAARQRGTNTALEAFAVDVAVAQLSQLQSTYMYCLEAYQLPTQMATFGLFSASGDAIAQQLDTTDGDDEESATQSPKQEYDVIRTFHYLLKGLGGGILWSYWYSVADPCALQLTQALGGVPAGAWEHAARVAAAIFLEQMVWCPIVYAAWDIPVPALLKGSPPRQIPDQVRSKLGPLLWANAKVWTPVNVITYNLPSEWRLLFCSVMDLVWQSVNSRITSQDIVVVEGEEGQSAADESMSTTLSSSSSSRPATTGLSVDGSA